MCEVAGIEVDPESGPVPDRGECLARGHEVVRDFGRMHLETEANALLVEDVDDRIPACGEVREASLDLGPVIGRKRVEHVPGRRAGEAVDLLDSELCGRTSCVHHLTRGALAHALRVAI